MSRMRGRKPKPAYLKLVTGNPGKRPLPPPLLQLGPIERPKRLGGKAGELWDGVIARCWWLAWPDGPKALVWCHLQAEFERSPRKTIAARIALLRGFAND